MGEFGRLFYLVTPEKILLEILLVLQGFSDVLSILETGFKLSVIVTVCSKMYSTKTGVVEYRETLRRVHKNLKSRPKNGHHPTSTLCSVGITLIELVTPVILATTHPRAGTERAVVSLLG